MNAVNPVQSSPLPSPSAAEPSMEEILASIRRIIADDSVPVGLPAPQDLKAGHAAESDEPSDEPDDLHHEILHAPEEPQVVDMGRQERESEPHVAAGDMHRPADHGAAAGPDFVEEPPSHESQPGHAAPLPEVHVIDLPPHPLAPEAAHHDPVDRGPEPPEPQAAYGAQPESFRVADEPERLFSAATGSSVASAFNALAASRFVDNSEQLTGLVREMVRPLVKAWVDENLPAMVERIVAAEIERMARR